MYKVPGFVHFFRVVEFVEKEAAPLKSDPPQSG
jgi:hypothetical protein